MARWRNLRTSPLRQNSTLTRVILDGYDVAPYAKTTRVLADQTIANSTNTAVTFNAALADTDGMVDISGAATKITVRTAGVYLFEGEGAFAANATGSRVFFIYKNGSTALGTVELPVLSASAVAPIQVHAIAEMAVGDYVELVCVQFSGGNLNLASATKPASLSAIRLRDSLT